MHRLMTKVKWECEEMLLQYHREWSALNFSDSCRITYDDRRYQGSEYKYIRTEITLDSA